MTQPEADALLAAIRAHAPNFRPLGEGLIAPGLLYRSGELASLDGHAWAAMERIGIRTLIDLRGPMEIEAMPVRPPAAMRLVSIPLHPGQGAGIGAGAIDNAAAAQRIGNAYRHLVQAYGRDIAGILHLLAGEDALPAVLFCTAGKDRTGIVSALLLAAIGADSAAIHADYAITNAMLSGPARQRVWDMSTRLATFDMPAGPIVDAMLAADPAYLEAAFDAIAPLPAFFERSGLDGAAIDRLRKRLLPRA